MCDESGGFGWVELPSGLTVGQFKVLSDLGVTHAVTTRQGKETQLAAGDPATAARMLADEVGLNGVAWCQQVHGSQVFAVGQGGLAGDGDGLITANRGLGLVGRSADCPLVLLADPVEKVAAVFHAGWRGTVAGVAGETIRTMVSRFACAPMDVIACVCPSAGKCCYEVGMEVQAAAVEAFGARAKKFFVCREGSLFFDMWQAIADQLLRVGVARQNIYNAGLCTICHNNIFPSFRQEGDKAGRFQAIVALS